MNYSCWLQAQSGFTAVLVWSKINNCGNVVDNDIQRTVAAMTSTFALCVVALLAGVKLTLILVFKLVFHSPAMIPFHEVI